MQYTLQSSYMSDINNVRQIMLSSSTSEQYAGQHVTFGIVNWLIRN